MKGIGRQWCVSLVSAFVLCPGAAMVADGPSGETAAIPTVAMFLALVVVVFACIVFRRRALAAEAIALRLTEQTALRGEQAIIRPFAGAEINCLRRSRLRAEYRYGAGVWYDSLQALLCGPDRHSLEQAVDGLRQNRHDLNMAVKTRDGARTFSVCGYSIVFPW